MGAKLFHAYLWSNGAVAAPDQNENITCKSTRRLADWVLNTPPASAVDSPNRLELRYPMGGAAFTWLKMLRALALKVRL